MRSIPAELKARIEKANMTLYENADPHMNIFVYNSRWNELFTVYTVHNKPNIDRIDVTAKREMASSDPNKLYAIYIEDGVSHVISKPLPYNELIPWDYEFQVGSASDIAIEFNGYWERDPVSKRFNFISDEFPWVFKQSGGSLTAQYWDESPLELATGVGRICSMRGWIPAQAGHTQDQGLIVAYLKSGTAYYRNYCLQSDGTTYLWETEQEITELPTGLTDIALFRTNDFRIGVLGRDASGQVHMTVTIRNWAGMSLYPETLSAKVLWNKLTVDLKPLEFIDVNTPNETVTVKTDETFLFTGLCPAGYQIAATGQRVDSHIIKVAFNYDIINIGSPEDWTADGNRTVQSLTKTGNELTLTLTSESDAVPLMSDTTFSYSYGFGEMLPLSFYVTESCQVPLHTTSVIVEGDIPDFEQTATVKVDTTELSINLKQMEFIDGIVNETATVKTDMQTFEITMTYIGEDPV